jgi:hypothetical protein
MTERTLAPRSRIAVRAAGSLCTAVGTLSTGHLLILLAAAVLDRRERFAGGSHDLALAVVIPAHDEEDQVAAAVQSVMAADYRSALRRVIVVADNCSDQTASVARSAGAEVWERHDPDRRGKGYALDWAFPAVLEDESVQAVCVVDADCEISGNLLEALASRLRSGADAAQAAYLISNPEESQRAALRWAGFALFNVVRPLGRDRLGLSCGLLGTGMAISRELLERSPWAAFSFAEDREQHMRWVLSGARVAYVREAQVRSPAPTGAAAGGAQEARWDSGRGRLIAQLTPRLLARGARTRQLAPLDAALEPLLPPQSGLFAANALAVAISKLAGPRVAARWAIASLLAQAAYVIGGLAILRAPKSVWRALLHAPGFIARRLLMQAGSATGRAPSAWERTPRSPQPNSPRRQRAS